jgi:hypothetical protein
VPPEDSFANEVAAFSGLVSLILVFIGIFTQQRAERLRILWNAAPTQGEALRAVLLNALLCFTTIMVFATGARIWVDALGELSLLPGDADSAARSLLGLAWIFLGGLVTWQMYLVYDAVTLFRERSA